MDAIPGDVLARRYQLGALVGVGGTARVYRARDQVDDTTVAVKLFPAGTAAGNGPDDVHRDGSRELAALGGMAHPGLVEVRTSGVDDDGRPFVVMDFVDGQSLATRMRAGALPAAAVTVMGTTLADALAHVHSRGVVHRDVKPGNVLLDAAGRARLTDFGIARLVDATRVTATGLVVGTAAYMAPEQVRGEVVGPPADIYALGLVLLEAVTGRREFEGGALEAAIARLHRSPVVPADVPEPLARQIRRMTATDPDERPAAPDVAAALRRPPVRRSQFDGPLARRFVAAGALASLAASVVAATVLLTGADTATATPEEPPVVIAAPQPVDAPPAATVVEDPADEPAAIAPTAERYVAPVPVALARPTTVTRTGTRSATVPTRTPTRNRPAVPVVDRGDDKGEDKGDNDDEGTGGAPVDDNDNGNGGDDNDDGQTPPTDDPADPVDNPTDPADPGDDPADDPDDDGGEDDNGGDDNGGNDGDGGDDGDNSGPGNGDGDNNSGNGGGSDNSGPGNSNDD